MWGTRTVTEITYTFGDAFAGIGYAGIVSGILIVGLIVWYLIIWGSEYFCCGNERRGQWVVVEKQKDKILWKERPWQCCGSVKHLISQTIFISGIVIIIWLASASAGQNPWLYAAAGLGLSVIATYGAATPLSLFFSAYAMSLTNAIAVGYYVQFYGMGGDWEGRISAIFYLKVEMLRFDPLTGSTEIVSIPSSTFLTTPWKRNMNKEFNEKTPCKDPSECVAKVEARSRMEHMV